jgi:hypothetical protein
MGKKSVLCFVLTAGICFSAFAQWTSGQIKLVDEKSNWGKEVDGFVYWHENLAREISWVPGHKGEGIDTDGHLKTHLRFDTGVLKGAKAFTLSAWVYWRGAGMAIFGKYADDDTGQLIYGISGPKGHFKITIEDNEQGGGIDFAGGLYNKDVYCASGVHLPKNTWAMITAALDGSYMTIYLNGVEISKKPQTVTLADIGVDLFRIGSSFWGPPSLNAIIDEACVWQRALSANEVFTMYNETK